jgi:hypothetical protein
MTGNCATFAIDGTRKVAITLPKSTLQKSVEIFQEVDIFEERSKDALKEVECLFCVNNSNNELFLALHIEENKTQRKQRYSVRLSHI